MTSRFSGTKKNENEPLVDSFDQDVLSLKTTVTTLKMVSTEIGNELERQNSFLKTMSIKYHQGTDMVSNLVSKMNNLIKASDFSPVTMTIFFAFLLFVFLWIYWKVFA